MARTTIKQALRNCLKDLSKTDFLTFCQQLRDRREEPLVSYSDVEDKSILEITDLLVSIFTERKALPVALDILRQINCNDVAETLYSNTKVCVDKGDPTFRKTSTGALETKPSEETLNHADGQSSLQATGHRGPNVTVKKPEEVEAEAKALILSEGGDLCNKRLVLSRHTLQFGKYKGQTFKWLLENDVGYTAYVVAGHQKQQRPHAMRQDSRMANKDSLTRYAIAYPEVVEEVRIKNSLQSGQDGKALVGFGAHTNETLQHLYESKDEDSISYVNYLRGMKSKCDPGTRMEVVIGYILQRDKTLLTKRVTKKKKKVQSTRGQSASASRPTGRKLKRDWKRTRFPPLSRW